MKFSERIGIGKAKEIQLFGMDVETKNGLWDIVKICILDPLTSTYSTDPTFNVLANNLWHSVFKKPIDTIPETRNRILHYIRVYFFNEDWTKVYELLEYLATYNWNFVSAVSVNKFCDHCNDILKRENSGYRFIEGKLAPITNEAEIKSISDSIEGSSKFTSLIGSNTHLKTALELLSRKENPDYRNSIKESISAVESAAKVISGKEKDSLGPALEKIKSKLNLHASLERGFKQLYGWTSDGDGIRHGLMEGSACDIEDARYMLVSCSAFINYIIVKADKVGIKMQ